MPPERKCPPVEVLRELASGRLADPPVQEIEEHVLQCDECARQTAELYRGDTLIAAIQQAGRERQEVPAAERERLERLMDSLSGLPAQQTRVVAPSDSPGSNEQSPRNNSTSEFLAAWRPPQAADEIGRLGGYRILKMLGAGGMGGVFLAEDMQLRRRVALKIMRPEFAERPGAAERFLREARAAAALQHERIITIHQVGEDVGVPFLAMEYLVGESLAQRLNRESPLSIAEVLQIGRQMAEGLAAAHEQGVIHRDITPGNVFLTTRGKQPAEQEMVAPGRGGQAPFAARTPQNEPVPKVKLLDFGLARPLTEEQQLTQSGMIIGTPAYMSPEQARGGQIDARSDLFSLGCVLYQMLTGTLAFQGDSVLAVLSALANHNPAPPRTVRPEVPQELSDLVMQLLAKDPRQRPATAAEFVRRIETIETAAAAARAATVRPAASRGGVGKRRGWLTALALAGAAALAAVIIIRLKDNQGRETKISIDAPAGTKAIVETPDNEPPKKPNSVPPVIVKTPSGPASPLDALDPAKIPAAERFAWQPKELVAVIGEHRLNLWGGVMSMAYHPGGSLFVANADVLGSIAFSSATFESAGEIPAHWGSLTFSTDGSRLAVGGDIYKVDLSNPQHPKFNPWRKFPEYNAPYGYDALSPDLRWLIRDHGAGKLEVWDLEAKPPKMSGQFPWQSDRSVTLMQFSRDGRRFVAAKRNDETTLWDVDLHAANGPTFTQHGTPFHESAAVQLSPDGNHLVAWKQEGESKFRVFDLRETPPKIEFEAEAGGSGFAAAFSADGNELVVSRGNVAQFFHHSEKSWQKVREIERAADALVTALEFSPDGKTLLVGDIGGRVNVWDLSQPKTPRLKNPPAAGTRVTGMALSPDGSKLATTGWGGSTVWDLSGAAPRRYDFVEGGGSPSISADGKLACFRDSNDGSSRSTRIWSLGGEHPERLDVQSVSGCLDVQFMKGSDRIQFLCGDADDKWHLDICPWGFNRRGRFVIDDPVATWKPPATQGYTHGKLHDVTFGRVQLSEAASLIATNADGAIQIWKFTEPSEKPIAEFKDPFFTGGQYHQFRLSQDGQVAMAFATAAQSLPIWDMSESPARKYELDVEFGLKDAVIVGNNLLAADDHGVAIYDWPKNRKIRRWDFPGLVDQVALAPDGRHIATANHNGTCYILRLPESLRPAKK